ncbi:hypothetical protein Taro_000389 [Colocasia esculenta]|uniref:non-specific serine/threonine protein kinase n=1 Tax=Colocasia esculenta TaxID=4460 RepID=A0A843TD55_COLES|nr:hypothetical protein [Colocasia esculenta]
MFPKVGRKAMRGYNRRSPFLAAFLAVLLSLVAATAAAVDVLASNAFINHTEFLVSSEDRFKLGFFSPANSNLLYLGIWYSGIPTLDVVWVANRQRPLPGTSTGFLTMAANGSLIVTDREGRVYWSTEAAQLAGGRVPAARLLDNGNLVVDTGGIYAWQSFDHPTDTMLPGMKLGYDRRRGVGTNFTSWRGTDDPSPGPFTMVMDPRGDPQVIILRGAAAWWRTGPWVGRQYSGIPDMRPYNNFSYSFVSNDEGIFYRYDVWDNSVLTKVVVNTSGSLVHQVWQNSTAAWESIWWSPGDRCDFYNVCGPNAICSIPVGCTCLPGFKPRRTDDWERGSTDAGCEPEKSTSACRDGKGEFKMVSSVKLPDTSGAAVDQSKGTVECRATCLRRCSCTAFTSSDGSGCITWSGELLDLRAYPAGQGQELYVRVADDMQYANESCHDDASRDLDLKIFPFGVIASATNNFTYANKLGEGGFGPVYKGILNGREDVAVKRLSKSSGQGLEEYKSEIQLMAKLQHTNLVKLLGCCIEAEEKILIQRWVCNWIGKSGFTSLRASRRGFCIYTSTQDSQWFIET